MEWALWRRDTAGVCCWALPVLVWGLPSWQLVPLAALAGALCLKLQTITISQPRTGRRILLLTNAVGSVLEWRTHWRISLLSYRPRRPRLSVPAFTPTMAAHRLVFRLGIIIALTGPTIASRAANTAWEWPIVGGITAAATLICWLAYRIHRLTAQRTARAILRSGGVLPAGETEAQPRSAPGAATD